MTVPPSDQDAEFISLFMALPQEAQSSIASLMDTLADSDATTLEQTLVALDRTEI